MQQQSHDFTRTHRKTYFTPSEAEPYDTLNNTRDSASAYGVQEQRPASALQAQEDEHPFYEDDGPGWEKATSYPRRKAQKGCKTSNSLKTSNSSAAASTATANVAATAYLLFFYESYIYFHCNKGSCKCLASHS